MSGDKGGGQPKRTTLDEKYFRRMSNFAGDPGKFRSWFFDLVVCIGQVDTGLGEELKNFLGRWDRDYKG